MGQLGKRAIQVFGLIALHLWVYGGLSSIAQASQEPKLVEESERTKALRKLRENNLKSRTQTLDALQKAFKDEKVAEKFKGNKGKVEFKKALRKGLRPYRDDQRQLIVQQKSEIALKRMTRQMDDIRQSAEEVGHEGILKIFDELDRKPKTTVKDQALALNDYFYNELIWEIENSLDDQKSVVEWIESIIDEMRSKQGDPEPSDPSLEEKAGWKPFDYITAGLVVGGAILVILHTVGLVSWSVASIGWGVLGVLIGMPLAIILLTLLVSWATYHTASNNTPGWDGLIPEEEEDKAKEEAQKETQTPKELP